MAPLLWSRLHPAGTVIEDTKVAGVETMLFVKVTTAVELGQW